MRIFTRAKASGITDQNFRDFYQSINRVRQDSAKLYPEACTVQNVVNKNCTVRTAVITTPCEMS